MSTWKAPASREEGTSRLSSVERTVKILETLAKHRKINLERLSGEARLPKPTVLRFLATLIDLGYVHRDENDQYALTLRMFSIGSKGLAHMDLTQDARPIAQALGANLMETVHMGVLDEDMAMYVLKIESTYTIRMYSRVGKRIPLYCTAIGKVLLAGMPEHEQEHMLRLIRLIPFTPHTITDPDALRAQLREIREQGFAEDLEEHEEGIRCIAAPVFDHTGATVAALSVSWPVFRFDPDKRLPCVEMIRESTRTISKLLGN
ncbi:MAG: IclR family transcriptional regulator C-terminal domain-containing protein [Sphaerochaetaceae bacterium]|jgi:IclR family KDG regulon transcriptional repressor|nr:IclR family transcriptional regulator C-terminal domain-containing protein [Sphaerochaetaceae bacterium]MDD3942040.1 IclR family transcriptional regulator C-terminal domain-containing protein [Sphaerochaetaceae bacterium]MDX9939186.1 IclR family transcriptional regulator C-terminal domain-containing protein [Sphaerochaetaceae bacterium]